MLYPRSMIARVAVVLALGLTCATLSEDKGLLWWNQLGNVEEVLNPPTGTPPNIEGDVSFVRGVFGDAYAAVGHSYLGNRIIIPAGGLELSPEAGTVDAWVMYPKDPIVWAYEYSMFSMLDGCYQCAYDQTLGCQATYQIGDGVTGFLYTLYANLRFRSDGEPVSIEIPDMDRVFHPMEWHHLALVWDRTGMDGSSDCFRVYIDGVIYGANTDNDWGIEPDTGNRHTVGKGEGATDYTPAYVIDNIKVWNRAALDAIEHRFEEDYGYRPPCLADMNGDDEVDVDDVFIVLGYWGLSDVPADINQDGTVDIDDLFEILAHWGPCE